jgi:hypothetical protein
MMNTALNKQKNSIPLKYSIKNLCDGTCEKLQNKPEEVLQESAPLASKQCKHNNEPIDINDELSNIFVPIENADLKLTSDKEPITKNEIKHVLKICG